jgi:ligand-binding sensor domain-containing protein/signal transduction histidine kinase
MSHATVGRSPIWRAIRVLPVCICGFLGPVSLFGLDLRVSAGDYIVHGWQTESGLPHNTVESILERSDGYLWLATDGGLARFDGNRFEIFNRSTRSDFLSSFFTSLVETADGMLWMGSSHGLCAWRGGKLHIFTTDDGLPSNHITCIGRMLDGGLAIGTTAGMAFIRDGRLVPAEGPFKQIDSYVRAYAQRPDGTQYVGSELGLYRISGERVERLTEFQELPGAARPGQLTGSVYALLETPNGCTWIGTSIGLHCIHPDNSAETFGVREGLATPRVNALERDHDGNLWIGTASGLFRMQDHRIDPAPYPLAFGSSPIKSFYEDREGILWIGTTTGLFFLKNPSCQVIGPAQGLEHPGVRTIQETADGVLWFGTWGSGVYRYDQQRASPLKAPPGVRLDLTGSLTVGPDDSLWIGSNSGLYRYAGGNLSPYYLGDKAEALLKQSAANPNLVLPGVLLRRADSVVSDASGDLWIGCTGHGPPGTLYAASVNALYRMRDGAFHNVSIGEAWNALAAVPFQPIAPADSIRSILVTRQGALWVAVYGGVARLQDNRWTTYTTAEGLAGPDTRIVFEDSAGSIWVTTDRNGLSRFKDGSWHVYSSQQGLPDNTTFSMMEDDEGYYWIGTTQGVVRIAQHDFDDLDAKRIDTLSCQIFTKNDGMPVSQCNAEGFPNVFKSRDGRILFPTDKGVAVFDPRRIGAAHPPPRVHIERMLVSGKEIGFGPSISLPPDHTDIQFQYTAINLEAPEQVRFRTELAPIDAEWHDSGSNRSIRYTRLPYGDYVLRVTAGNLGGAWNEEGASIAFSVRPFFYQTNGFRALVTVAAFGFAFGVYRWRVRRFHQHALELRRQNAELERRVAERTAELAKSYEQVKQAQKELLEVSRLAGMAEMATGVLHNIGNALNSVNTSATLAKEKMSALRIAGLGKIAQLLVEQGDNLPGFFANDPRGRQLPEYLKRLSDVLGDERDDAVHELDGMRSGIDHIGEIVAAQQSHAHAAGFTETVAPAELFDYAIRLSEASLARHDVAVARDFAQAPNVKVQRQKAIQILANVIRNAKEAEIESGRPDKQIVLGIRMSPAGMVQLTVRDHGVGIAPENLTRIFNFGFTTKKEGHGFGLHSSANTARELGGSLTAQSDGPGTGATFIFELPSAEA